MPVSYDHLTFPIALPRLAALLSAVEQDAARIVDRADPAAFTASPAPGAWSAAQCLDHLTLTTRVYVAAMARGVERAARGTQGGGAAVTEVSPGALSRW